MSVYSRLQEAGITLPPAGLPAAAYVMASRTGNNIHLSGHIARVNGQPLVGRLGRTMTTAEGYDAARLIAIDLLATLHRESGNLDFCRPVKLVCLVNSDPEFTEHHIVANGASELLANMFAETGRHARSAFGVAQIPFGSCVEIEAIFELDNGL
jgi:enamine deaminase RidA (YjgF/YER057c/UK114 family)